MTQYLGDFQYGATVYIPFASYNSAGASVTLTGLAATDIEIYKNGSVTQRASDAGYTLLDTDGIDFDALTGIHGFSIDTSDNTTAGFWGPGNDYFVAVASVTIDGQTVNFIYSFSIENRIVSGLLQRTTIATLASQTSFTLTAGSADDNAYNGCMIEIYDQATPVQKAVGVVGDYTGSTKTVTMQTDPAIFTMATGDYVVIIGDRALKSTVDNRTADVSAGGEVGLDWANIGSPTTAQNLSGTNIDVDQVVASVSGAVGSVTGAVGSVAAAGITAASFAADAITAAKIADGAIDAATFAAGAINAAAIAADAITAAKIADGAIDAATFAASAITSTVLAADAITAAKLHADVTTELQSGLSTLTIAQVATEIADALTTDTYAEPGQGAPAATTTLAAKINYLYKAWRNKSTQTATDYKLFADDASTVDQKAATSDDATTFTKGEVATGP